MLGGLPRHEHGTGHICREYPFKTGEIHLDEWLVHADACIVHQNVEMIEYLKQFLVASKDICFLAYVCEDGMGPDRRAGGDQSFLIAARYRDLRAGLDQHLRNGETDAARSS